MQKFDVESQFWQLHSFDVDTSEAIFDPQSPKFDWRSKCNSDNFMLKWAELNAMSYFSHSVLAVTMKTFKSVISTLLFWWPAVASNVTRTMSIEASVILFSEDSTTEICLEKREVFKLCSGQPPKSHWHELTLCWHGDGRANNRSSAFSTHYAIGISTEFNGIRPADKQNSTKLAPCSGSSLS